MAFGIGAFAPFLAEEIREVIPDGRIPGGAPLGVAEVCYGVYESPLLFGQAPQERVGLGTFRRQVQRSVQILGRLGRAVGTEVEQRPVYPARRLRRDQANGEDQVALR